MSGALKKRPAEPESASRHQYSRLARFIFQSGHYRKSAPSQPKPGAFLPNPSKLQTSAIWRDALPEQEIWKIGDLLGAKRGEQPPARADFDIAAVIEAKLTIEADPVTHPRHVNICKWPVDKAEQKSIALILCARSTLMLRPVSEQLEP